MDLGRTSDRLAIVGFCNPHRDWLNYEDEDLEIWGLNRGYIFMERATRWFEMHGPSIHEWQQRRPGAHLQYLKMFPGPVYMHQARPDLIPHSVDYPLQAIADDIGSCVYRFAPKGVVAAAAEPRSTSAAAPPEPPPASAVLDPMGELLVWAQTNAPYIASSIAQELALAIHLGFREIWLYGIDLNTSSEYAWQKPGVEHLLGLAAGRGIKVYVPDMCPLLKGPIYGRGYLSPRGEQLSPEQWMERIHSLEQQKRGIEAQVNQILGAKREVEYLLSQMVPGMDHEMMDQRRASQERTLGNLNAQLLQCVGALQETLYWAHQTPNGQDASEALAQTIAAANAFEERDFDPTAALAGLAAENLETNGHMPSEGPAPDSIEWAIADTPQSTSGELVTVN